MLNQSINLVHGTIFPIRHRLRIFWHLYKISQELPIFTVSLKDGTAAYTNLTILNILLKQSNNIMPK